MSFLPEIDAFTGIRTNYSWDEDSKTLILKRTQDCNAIIDLNKARQNENDQSWRKKEDRWMLFASIPNLFIEAWLKEGINVYNAKTDRHGKPNEDMVRVLRKLEDPDYKHLKTTTMRMG
jgi:hypothetical protein